MQALKHTYLSYDGLSEWEHNAPLWQKELAAKLRDSVTPLRLWYVGEGFNGVELSANFGKERGCYLITYSDLYGGKCMLPDIPGPLLLISLDKERMRLHIMKRLYRLRELKNHIVVLAEYGPGESCRGDWEVKILEDENV